MPQSARRSWSTIRRSFTGSDWIVGFQVLHLSFCVVGEVDRIGDTFVSQRPCSGGRAAQRSTIAQPLRCECLTCRRPARSASGRVSFGRKNSLAPTEPINARTFTLWLPRLSMMTIHRAAGRSRTLSSNCEALAVDRPSRTHSAAIRSQSNAARNEIFQSPCRTLALSRRRTAPSRARAMLTLSISPIQT